MTLLRRVPLKNVRCDVALIGCERQFLKVMSKFHADILDISCTFTDTTYTDPFHYNVTI